MWKGEQRAAMFISLSQIFTVSNTQTILCRLPNMILLSAAAVHKAIQSHGTFLLLFVAVVHILLEAVWGIVCQC